MLKMLNTHIINILLNYNIIQKKDIEIYEYGIRLYVNKILHSLIILLMGFLYGQFFDSILFLLTYSQLRNFAGGFHAKSNILCALYTYILTLVFMKANNRMNNASYSWCIIIYSIVFSLLIYFLAPVDSLNKPLSRNEIFQYRKITGLILLFSNILIFLLNFFNISFYSSIFLSIIFEAFSLVIGLKTSPRYRR